MGEGTWLHVRWAHEQNTSCLPHLRLQCTQLHHVACTICISHQTHPIHPPPAEGVRAVFLPWLAPKPRLSGMQRQIAEELAVQANAARKMV